MKKIYLLCFIFLVATAIRAQVPEDALRYSYYLNQGSARNMAIGGAMASLGGEITSIFINPAGLGTFRNREVVISPIYGRLNNKHQYRDSTTESKKGRFGLGSTGYLLGIPNERDSKKSMCLGFAVQQTANFRNEQKYSGYNNYSSFSEQFAEELAKSNLSIDQVLTSNSPLPYTSAPALYTYLIDTVTINGITQVRAAPEYLLDSGKSIIQDMHKSTRGSMHEIAFSFSSHHKEKWLYGFTLSMPFIQYNQKTTFNERDPSTDTSNRFGSFSYTDEFTSFGSGVQGKLGVIYRPAEHIRLGFAFHSPAMLVFSETRNTFLSTVIENPVKTYQSSSQTFTNGQEGNSRYTYRTPWRALVSASYVFREEDNIPRQKGFITADLEYVRHSSGRYTSENESPTDTEIRYFKQLTQVIKDNYKGTFHLKLGGELKFKIFMLRAGFAYASNPYRDEAFRANRMQISGGLGYRNHGFYIDLTYLHQNNNDVDMPYRLSDRANTFSSLRQRGGTILATAGFKF
jgi:hypothetical protein